MSNTEVKLYIIVTTRCHLLRPKRNKFNFSRLFTYLLFPWIQLKAVFSHCLFFLCEVPLHYAHCSMQRRLEFKRLETQSCNFADRWSYVRSKFHFSPGNFLLKTFCHMVKFRACRPNSSSVPRRRTFASVRANKWVILCHHHSPLLGLLLLLLVLLLLLRLLLLQLSTIWFRATTLRDATCLLDCEVSYDQWLQCRYEYVPGTSQLVRLLYMNSVPAQQVCRLHGISRYQNFHFYKI